MIRALLFFILAASSSLFSQSLDIYFIDVEGGAATLIVTPQKESVLIDSGWRRDDGRDAQRIVEVATREAGLQQIDYLVTTHFHRDHYGGVLRLSQLIPIRNFLDHGPMAELKEDPQFPMLYTEYLKANRGERQTLKPGQTIALKQGKVPLKLTCLAARRQTLTREGAPNPLCSQSQPAKEDLTDNAASVGLLLRFGDFEFLDNGDLTWNIESKLVCPTDVIGNVDAYQVTHHGLSSSNNPVLLRSASPTIAIVNNGPKKGGQPEVYRLLTSLESLKDIFQVHRNIESSDQDNTSPDLIANLGPEEGCAGHWIRLSVSPDASTITVTNSRNGVSKSYPVTR
ncbi:MAG: ComEC/Rec2 family competence protein [Acidobacteriota bacterium]